MNERNLLKETIHDMDFHGYKPEDISIIMNKTHNCTWDRFKELANKKGIPDEDLVIVFKNSDMFIRAERKFGFGEGWELVKHTEIISQEGLIENLFMVPKEISEKEQIHELVSKLCLLNMGINSVIEEIMGIINKK